MDFYRYNKENIETIMSKVLYLELDKNINEDDAFEMLKFVLSLRHDLLQCLICEQLQMRAELGVGQKMFETMGLDEDNALRFTPDIYYTKDDEHFFIDPGISRNPIEYEQKKIQKYQPAIDKLISLGFQCRFIPICVRPDLFDLDSCIVNPIPWPPREEILIAFQNNYDYITKVVEFYKPLCKEISLNTEDQSDSYFTRHLGVDELLAAQAKTSAGSQQLNINYKSFDEFKEIFYTLVDDPDVFDFLRDTEINKDTYKRNFVETIGKADHDNYHAKPSFHIPYAPDIRLPYIDALPNLKADQFNSLNILRLFSGLPDDDIVCFIKHIYKNSMIALQSKGDFNMFNSDCYTGDYDLEFKLKQEKPKNLSMRSYMQSKGVELRDTKPRVLKGRVISIGSPQQGKDFLFHSGVNYSKHMGPRVYKKPRDCPSDSYNVFDRFYNLVCEPSQQVLKPDPLVTMAPGNDSNTSNTIKEEAIELYERFHQNISRTHIYRMALHSSIVAKSLIHFNNMNTKEGDFTLINSGLRNVCHIMHGGKRNKGNDQGNPFFTLVITDDNVWATNVFGSHTVYTSNGLYYIVYHWRRLSSNRLSFIADSYLSCQSTGFDSFLRMDKSSLNREEIKKCYGFRSLVSLCTTQRLAEILMDVRYLCMSFISDYSDVVGLIKEKFSPRYPNCFVYWVVVNICNKVDELIHDYNQPGNIIKKMAVYSSQRRLQDSTGGNFNILSIWSNTRVYNLQDLLDELFVYCHTMKEPSSIFHEFKKCFKTIFDFQTSFDKMPERSRYGKYDDAESLKKWILSIRDGVIKPMGCWDDACYHAAHMIDEIKRNPKFTSQLRRSTNMEPLSELVSTKACIPEYRLIDVPGEKRKRAKENKEKLRDFFIKQGVPHEEYNVIIRRMSDVNPGSVVLKEKKSGRMKVIDCIQDFLIRYPTCKTVLDVANWNISHNYCRSVADVCVKAQYGAKREFYVLNFGAKCMLRVLENTYKVIAEFMPEEMISCPGDTKLKHMAELSDYAIRWSPDSSYKLYFVNGDCTKWSASETLTSFLAFTDGLRQSLGEELTEFCKAALSAWSNKEILIPNELLEGTIYLTEQNSYLKLGTSIHSTQNFLQGMLNYSSSVKSIAATRLAIALWNERHGEVGKIMVKQLGHSDDYILLIRSSSEYDLVKFRVYHKLMQRLVGITDSSKKTNVQQHIMEFISLMSFNGQMSYPNIKKTKETGLNIACEGYQRDAMTITSRSGESVRLGVPLLSAYIQQRLHCSSLYRAYALGTGMRNEIKSSQNPYNWPIELFGLPDCLPIININSYCDPNNVRLYRYNAKARGLICSLFELSKEWSPELSYNPIDTDMLFNPVYTYKRTGGVVKKIRDILGLTREDILKFYEDCPEYKIMKPNCPVYLLAWMQCLYYNNSFSKAYAVVSRPNLMLRLSFFVSNACIRVPWTEKPMRIKDYFNEITHKLKPIEIKTLEPYLSSYNANVTIVFDILENNYIHRSNFKPQNAQAMHLPKPIKHIKILNNLSNVIQRIISPERFKLDGRVITHPGSFRYEVAEIEKLCQMKIENLKHTHMIRLHSLMRSQTTQSKYGIGYSSASDKSSIIYVQSWLENGVNPNNKYILQREKLLKVNNPLTGEFLFERDYGMSTSYSNICIENLTMLYYLLVSKEGWSLSEFRNTINNVKLKESDLKTIMNTSSIDYSNMSDYLHKRMFAFFKYILYNDASDLMAIVNSTLSYKYKFFDKKDIEREHRLNPNVIDGVYIRYQNDNYAVIKMTNGNHYVESMVTQLTRLAYVMNVGKMLMRSITFEQHSRAIKEGLIREIDIDDENTEPGFFRIGRTIQYLAEPSEFPRLNITKRVISHIPSLNQSSNNNQDFTINIRDASVSHGGVLLFRLSLYSCSQNCVIDYIPGKIREISIQNLIKDNLIYWYIHGHANAPMTNFDIDEVLKPRVIGIDKLILRNEQSAIKGDDKAQRIMGLEKFGGTKTEQQATIKISETELKLDGEFNITFLDEDMKPVTTSWGKPDTLKIAEDLIQVETNFVKLDAVHSSEDDTSGFSTDDSCLNDDDHKKITTPKHAAPAEVNELDNLFNDDMEDFGFYDEDNGSGKDKSPEILSSPKKEKTLEENPPQADYSAYLTHAKGFFLDDRHSTSSVHIEEPNLPKPKPDYSSYLNMAGSFFEAPSLEKITSQSKPKPDYSSYLHAAENFFSEANVDDFNLEGGWSDEDLNIEESSNTKAIDNPAEIDFNLKFDKEIGWSWDETAIEEARDLNTLNIEGIEIIEDLDAPPITPESSSESSSDSSNDFEDLPMFFQIKSSGETLGKNYISKMIERLPNIEDFLMSQYIGITCNALTENPEMLFEALKFSNQAEHLLNIGYLFTTKEIQAIKLINNLLVEIASRSLLTNGVEINGWYFKTTDNCRIGVERVQSFNMEERAKLIAKATNGRVEKSGPKFYVYTWNKHSKMLLFKPPTKLSRILTNKTFGSVIEDVEGVLNDYFSIVENILDIE